MFCVAMGSATNVEGNFEKEPSEITFHKKITS